jgi:hypothetical protein
MSRKRSAVERPDVTVTIRPLKLSAAEHDRVRAKLTAFLIDFADRHKDDKVD